MKLIVLPQAADEFGDAVAHYDDKQAGLGQRFRDEVDQHIRWIMGHADVPRLRPGGYRRVNFKVFPTTSPICGSVTRFGFWPSRMGIGSRSIGLTGNEAWVNQALHRTAAQLRLQAVREPVRGRHR